MFISDFLRLSHINILYIFICRKHKLYDFMLNIPFEYLIMLFWLVCSNKMFSWIVRRSCIEAICYAIYLNNNNDIWYYTYISMCFHEFKAQYTCTVYTLHTNTYKYVRKKKQKTLLLQRFISLQWFLVTTMESVFM